MKLFNLPTKSLCGWRLVTPASDPRLKLAHASYTDTIPAGPRAMVMQQRRPPGAGIVHASIPPPPRPASIRGRAKDSSRNELAATLHQRPERAVGQRHVAPHSHRLEAGPFRQRLQGGTVFRRLRRPPALLASCPSLWPNPFLRPRSTRPVPCRPCSVRPRATPTVGGGDHDDRCASAIDIPCDVQQVDETGLVWRFLDEARDPSVITEGAIVVSSDNLDRVLARVVKLTPHSARTLVHLQILPGDPLDYVDALARAHLLTA